MNRTSITSVDVNPYDSSASDKYALIAELGQGGMSVVHLATSRSLGNVQKLVVLKSIRPELLESEKVRTMFMDEARLSIRLTHPNIVQTYEVSMIDGCPIIVMEYMEGQSLSALLRRAADSGGLPLAIRLRVLSEALNGLDHAHNLADYDGSPIGLVHRDVSPQNIFITYDGHVKILDFGIAKALDQSAHTEVGEIKGKIRYMAPEQMQSSLELDRRADVFAVGVMLWEAIASRRLWQGVKDVEVMKVVLMEGIPSPRSVNPDVDSTLEAICVKATARDPADRYESCAAMHAELERAAEQLGMRVSDKQVGAHVQQHFGEVRGTMRRAIERQLKATGLPPVNLRRNERGLIAGDTPISGSGAGRSRPLDAGATPSALGVTDSAMARRGARWPFAVVPLVILALALAFTLKRPAAAEPTETPLVRAAALAGQQPMLQPTHTNDAKPTLSVSIIAVPADATLFLDGVALPRNPITKELPSDGAEHEIRAEAKGYDAKSTTTRFEGTAPLDVKLVLTKKKPGKAAARYSPSSPPQAGPAARPTAPTPNCTNPFYVDAAGIRRLRPECV